MDGAAVLFFCDAVHDRFRSRFRITGGSARPRALRINHVQIHGAHPPLRDRAHFYPGHDHHADAGHPDVDRDGTSDVSPLRKLHLDCVADGAPQIDINRRLIAWTILPTSLFSAHSLSFSAL